MIGSLLSALAIAFSAVMFLPVVRFLHLAGVYPDRSGELNAVLASQPPTELCRALKQPVNTNLSCETVVVNDEFGIAYLACDTAQSRRKYNPTMWRFDTAYSGHGSIYQLDLQTEELTRLPAVGLPANTNLSLIGMDFYLRDADGGGSREAVLSVINHHPEGSRIHQFVHARGAGTLAHLQTIPVPPAISLWPNALAHDSGTAAFYITSGPVARSLPAAVVERLYPVEWSSVSRFDPRTQSFAVVADGIHFANGIAATPTHVYVASSSGHMHVFRASWDDSHVSSSITGNGDDDDDDDAADDDRRDNTAGRDIAAAGTGVRRLDLEEKVAVPSFLDNLSVDQRSGAVYAVAHASFVHLIIASRDPSGAALSSGLVFRLRNNSGEDVFYGHRYASRPVFNGANPLFSSISHAALATRSNKTVFGALFSPPIICDWLL
ncbi:hypothetical protein HDU82_003409 [Entophlyctis luteolus]|nr:hypothetical protein HDU82_003409 [Entophlyctis luteolus]